MAYTLIQSASGSIQVGTSLNVILPSAPTPGNSLLLIIATATSNNLFITNPANLTMTGVTFGFSQFGSKSGGPSLNMFTGFPILFGAGNQLTIGLFPAHQNKATVAFLFEYAGLPKDGSDALDRSAVAQGVSNIADSGDLSFPSEGDSDFIIGAVANMNGATQQTVITNPDFTRIGQLSSDPAGGDSDVNLAIYAAVATGIIPAGVRFYEATLEASHSWLSRTNTYFPDTSVVYELAASIDAFIIDTAGLKYNDLSVAVAEENLMPVSMSVIIDPIRTRTAEMISAVEVPQRVLGLLNMRIVALEDNATVGGPIPSIELPIVSVHTGGDRFYVAGDFTASFPLNFQFIVSGSTGNDGVYNTHGLFSSSYSGGQTVIFVVEDITDPTIDGNVQFYDGGQALGASFFASVPMDISIVKLTELEPKIDVLIAGGLGIEVRAGLDVAVLDVPPDITSFTTPEDNRYIACQPRWCGVPKQYSSVASMNVSIVAIELAQALLDLWITDTPADGVPTVDLEPQPAIPVAAVRIVGVSTSLDRFTVFDDLRRGIDPWRDVTLHPGAEFRIKGSVVHNGLYNVSSIDYPGGNFTYIYVTQDVTSSTTDGYVEIQQGKTFAAMDILIDGERSV